MSEVFASDLPSGPRFVLLAYADNADDEGVAYPSQRTVADKTGNGQSTVRRHVSWLVENGLMRERPRWNDSTVYRIDRDALRARARVAIRTRQTRPGDAEVPDMTPTQIGGGPKSSRPPLDLSGTPAQIEQTPTQNERLTVSEPSPEPSSEPSTLPRAAREDVSDDEGALPGMPIPPQPEPKPADEYEAETGFVEFWTSYPRKIDKRAALRAYRAARKRGVTVDRLLLGSRAYALECKGRELRYVKHPSSWLNADAHANEPERPTAVGPAPAGGGRGKFDDMPDEPLAESSYDPYSF